MKIELVIFQEDGSFDYGPGTCYCYDDHGFTYEFDENDRPVLSSLEGFGYFWDIKECKTYAELWEYLKNVVAEIEAGKIKYVCGDADPVDKLPIIEELIDACFEALGIYNKDINKGKAA